ncbi:hypothetical protein Tco_1092924 [Tanacetum coccineum]|uniref:Reverse transcriptase domain-containing protein n=1 Tax=Tanacetum coccineum TaxID=301880 RepID=A0ABQ5ICH6_9ASTR
MPNEPHLSEGHTSGSRKGRMEHQFDLTANVPITPHDSLLLGGYTPRSVEELSDEQAFRLQTSHPNTDQSASSLVKIKAHLDFLRISKSFSKLEQHYISLELAMQLNKDIFQKNNTSVNQTKPTFDHLFDLNNLKTELQAKDTTIEKLKANIKRLNKTSTTNSVKKDIDEIETINIELEHRVAKLIAQNEHLKQTYKQLYDSIKPSRIRDKEHADLWKFKGHDIIKNVAQVSNATTIAPGLYKLDPVTLAPKNNRETHIYYLKHTMEQAAILREIVEKAKSLNPLDSASYSACKYVKLIQELLGNVRDTCPDIHKPSEKLVTATPINKKKTIRHELCFLKFVSDMNASSKSKSVKIAKNKEEWKPAGKVITATNKVPLREPIPLEVVAQESVVTKVYIRRPKVPKTNGSNSKPNIAKSVISKKMKPGTSRGSNTLVAPSSSSLVDLRRSKAKRVKPFSLEESPVVTMADQCTMAELLQAPTEGYGDAIVNPAILAENFELKHDLLNLVTSKRFYGFEKEDPSCVTFLFECLALADLGASIKLMPLSIWKKLSLPELTPTQMILELADRSTTSPSELTLRVDDEAITFKVGQTSRYSYNDDVSINQIDVIDVACEEYAKEVLGFLDSSTSGNPTSSLDPILSTSSPSLTAFEEGIDNDDFDPEGDLLLLEKLLNDDPSSPLPPKELPC